MTADYQSARSAKSATAPQTGAVGTLVSVARGLGGAWIRHCDLAARRRPKLCIYDALSKAEGAGKAGCPRHPQSCARDAHDGPQVRRNTRPSLRSGFNGLWRALPGDEFVLPPSLTDWRSIEARLGSTISISLTPATGAGTTRFCRPQLPSRGAPTGLMCCRPKFLARAFKRRSSARDDRSRKTALRSRHAPDAAASTATCPNVRDDGRRPSGGTGWREFYF